jgi:hypothetical protein
VIRVADEHHVDRILFEAGVGLRRNHADHVVQAGSASAREIAVDERARDVDRIDATVRPDSGGEQPREKPGARADVGDRLPGLRCDRVDDRKALLVDLPPLRLEIALPAPEVGVLVLRVDVGRSALRKDLERQQAE